MAEKADLKQLFGTSVQNLRKQLGMTQLELAARTGLHRTYISDVERGARNVSLEAIAQLARGLDVSISALFTIVDGPPTITIKGAEGS